MKTNIKLVVGSLVGALVIHAGLIACSGGSSTPIPVGRTASGLSEDNTATAATPAPASPLKGVTADQDSHQLLRGASPNTGAIQKVVDGPFILTDADPGQGQIASNYGNETAITLETSGSTCAGNGTVFLQVGQTNVSGEFGNFVHGGRYLVPAGMMLCASGAIIWAGFKPYE